MDLQRIIVIEQEARKQAGRLGNPPARKVAACAVIANPFADVLPKMIFRRWSICPSRSERF